MVAGMFPVVVLAKPPEWLLLERPEAVPQIRKPKMEDLGLAPDLSRLPQDIRELIEHGNREKYPSRSEADWAVCVAMDRAGHGLDEIWMVMTSPENGISEKFFEKGSQGEAYLELTINKALHFVKAKNKRRGRVYARRRGGISID